MLKAAGDTIASAGLDPNKPYELVIDPLVDGKTGSQVKATAIMEEKILGVLAERAPNVKLVDFSAASLDRKPLLLIGSLTPVNNAGDAAGPKDAFAVWFKLADLSTGKVLGGGRARSQTRGVDLTPAPMFSESPIWTNDPVVAAYIKSCSQTKPGEPLDAVYLDKLRAAALIEDGVDAYDAGAYDKSLAAFQEASALPGGDQLRTWNGIYLSAWKLGNEALAKEAFGKALAYGFANNRVAVKFLFDVGTDTFVADRRRDGALRHVDRADRRERACVRQVPRTRRSREPDRHRRLQRRAVAEARRAHPRAADREAGRALPARRRRSASVSRSRSSAPARTISATPSTAGWN